MFEVLSTIRNDFNSIELLDFNRLQNDTEDKQKVFRSKDTILLKCSFEITVTLI